MKRVLNIVPYSYLPYTSGGQKLIALFNQYLGEKTDLHVAGTKDNQINRISNYQFHPILNASRFRYVNPLVPFRLISLIKKHQIETVILEHPYLGWLIPFFRLFTKVRIICHTHNVESERFRTIGKNWWRILKWYEGMVLKNCDKVFCITKQDRDFFVNKMQVSENKCIIVPYGIEEKAPPTDKDACKRIVCKNHQLDPSLPLLFFNGVLDYQPNLEALLIILEKIHPILLSKEFKYNMLIVGKRLPASYNELKAYNSNNIYYAGFVEEINIYTKAADILLNPVLTGGGVKTKMIEALGCDTSVVSTTSGAIGINPAIANHKLFVTSDNDWHSFTENIIASAKEQSTSTPEVFYKEFYWGNIIEKILDHLSH